MTTTAIRAHLAAVIAEAQRGGGLIHYAAADAVHREFVVIPRTDLPEVTVSDYGTPSTNLRVDGSNYTRTIAASYRRKVALRNVALAEYLEAEEAEQEAREAEAKAQAVAARRNERRIELARQFSIHGSGYKGISATAQRAIDHIITLEEAQGTP